MKGNEAVAYWPLLHWLLQHNPATIQCFQSSVGEKDPTVLTLSFVMLGNFTLDSGQVRC